MVLAGWFWSARIVESGILHSLDAFDDLMCHGQKSDCSEMVIPPSIANSMQVAYPPLLDLPSWISFGCSIPRRPMFDHVCFFSQDTNILQKPPSFLEDINPKISSHIYPYLLYRTNKKFEDRPKLYRNVATIAPRLFTRLPHASAAASGFFRNRHGVGLRSPTWGWGQNL